MPRPNAVMTPQDVPGPVIQYIRKRIKVGDKPAPNGLQIGMLPPNAIILPCYAKVITAFDGTGAIITAGNAFNATNIFSAGEITEGTLGVYGPIASGAAIPNSALPMPVWVQYAFGSATVGEAVLVIPFVADDDQ